VAGDASLAETVGLLARNLRWDFEEDLSRLMGDALAHRVGETVRGLERWRAQTAASWGGALGAYVTEEQPLVASRTEIEQFNGEVDRLRDDVERLAARIDRLRGNRNEPGGISA
jgi:ubiquinone biosynthesis protein UbiJ